MHTHHLAFEIRMKKPNLKLVLAPISLSWDAFQRLYNKPYKFIFTIKSTSSNHRSFKLRDGMLSIVYLSFGESILSVWYVIPKKTLRSILHDTFYQFNLVWKCRVKLLFSLYIYTFISPLLFITKDPTKNTNTKFFYKSN